MDIEVRIRGLMMDPATNMPIIVLKDVASDAVMPIWVGFFEVKAISDEIEKIAAPRPMTHDLTRNIIQNLNAQLERVVINELKNDTFLAVLFLKQGNERVPSRRPTVRCHCSCATRRLPHLCLGAGDADCQNQHLGTARKPDGGAAAWLARGPE